MEWTNEKVLEFLDILHSEPSLWDLRHKDHKCRGLHIEAWRRIKQALPFPVSIAELKKKKESLMGYYRIHLNKYKKSIQSGDSEIYSTNWFAYEVMDSFLRPVYESTSILNTVDNSSDTIESDVEDQKPSFNVDIENPLLGTSEDTNFSRFSIKRRYSSQSPPSSQSTGHKYSFMNNIPVEIIAAKKQMDEAYGCMNSLTSQKGRDFDEYDHFGLMIAAKLRKIYDSLERERLMNSVQNLLFESIISNNKRPRPE